MQYVGSAANGAFMRLRAGGSDQSTGDNYSGCAFRVLSNSTSGIVSVSEAANDWSVAACDDTAFPGIFSMDIHRPAQALRTLAMSHMSIGKTTTSEAQIRMSSHAHQQAVAYDGFTLFTGDATTMTGFVVVYGNKI